MTSSDPASRDARSRSFGAVAEEYDAYRPALPPEFVAAVGLHEGELIIDLAAGTGLATRTLHDAGLHVIAVEPDAEMRTILQRRSPTLDVRDGVGEAIPVSDNSVDAVVVVSAWHWMDHEKVLGEVARVLRDDGLLIIAWNGADQRVDWVESLFELRRPYRFRDGDERHHPRSVVLPADTPFTFVVDDAVCWQWPRTVDDIERLFTTFSGVLTASADERDDILTQVRRHAREHVDARGMVNLPMWARYWVGRRVPRPTPTRHNLA